MLSIEINVKKSEKAKEGPVSITADGNDMEILSDCVIAIQAISEVAQKVTGNSRKELIHALCDTAIRTLEAHDKAVKDRTEIVIPIPRKKHGE